VGLLHGRLPAEEKQEAIERFVQGRTQVLVSTTVIEVGIDVPNATVMTIFGAERFGLAQLHQLRGRIARGGHPGYVCLFTDREENPAEIERLRVFAETDDGFALAEADFRLRGPGDFFGVRQSGLPPLRIADLLQDQDECLIARQLALDLVEDDPDLNAADLQRLKKQMLRRYGNALQLGDVA
jgi:ATP-dependent DNA helicase RecG